MSIELADAMEGILDRIVELLEEQRSLDGRLYGLNRIVRGDRSRGLPDTPALFVVGMEADCDNTTHGLRESWKWAVGLLTLVKCDEPEEGYRQSSRYAAAARSVLCSNRGLEPLDYVSDVKSVSFNPSSPENSEKERGYFWASAVVSVSFTIMEV